MSKKPNSKKDAGLKLKNLAKSIKDMDVLGVAVIVLSNDGEILIGSDGLDQNTCQRLFQQSATIMAEEAGLGATVH
jgi:hypothetical protein